jgi:hypothetical protein
LAGAAGSASFFAKKPLNCDCNVGLGGAGGGFSGSFLPKKLPNCIVGLVADLRARTRWRSP